MNRKILLLCAAPLIAFSCQKQPEMAAGEGALSLSVNTAETKAAMTAEELLANADVRIYKADFSGMVRHYTYSEMPSSIYLPADAYRIDVKAGEAAKEVPATASWEQKSYKGSRPVTIEAGRSTAIEIPAYVSNVVSNITFDPSVSEFFAPGFSCTVGISSDESAVLVYTADRSGVDGYFIPSGYEPSLEWNFTGTSLKDGSTVSKTGTIPAVEGGKRYRMTLRYTEKNGLLDFTVLVDNTLNDVYDDIVFVPVSTGISASSRYEIWGGHYTAHADVDEAEYDPSGVYFEYRPAGTEEWRRTDAAVRESEGAFSTVIAGLSGATEYEYRLVVTAYDGTEEIVEGISTVTTEAVPQVPNSGFETTVWGLESNYYYSFYDPSSPDPELQSKWWCSGNQGSTTVGRSYQITYPDTSEKMEGNQSMLLESKYVIVKFAAGNLFSGRFGSTIDTSGGTVYFGRPFTARPTAMRLWVKYSGGKIDRLQDNVPDGVQKGDYDKASLRIALGVWDYRQYGGDANSPICVNTTNTDTFVDFNTDASTIAFGEEILVSDEANSTDVWRQVTIPLTYRNTSMYPTHIVISFAASMYGDYFTGYAGSKLWVDGLELLYE